LLIGETRFGTMVAAKVAARLKVGSLGRGKKLRVDGGRLVIERDAYGGRFVATVASKMPCVAVVQAGAYRAGDASPGAVETVMVTVGEPKVSIAETKQGQQGDAGRTSPSRKTSRALSVPP
jgi:electron transfer flavoprotein alpha subunit